jgi:putative membrane protein
MSKQSPPNVWEGMAAGIVGGLVASYVMGEFQKLWAYYAEEKKAKGATKKGRKSSKENEPATVKAASAISEGVFDHKLTKAEKKIAGPAVHYAMGATSGAIYGTVAELVPEVTAGSGMPFGTAVWLAVDDITVPAVGLAKWPTEYPLSTHVYALASHLVYGLTTEAVRRAVRSIF